jgi:hypothetical protein
MGKLIDIVARSPMAPFIISCDVGRTLNAYCGLLDEAAAVPFGFTVIGTAVPAVNASKNNFSIVG